MNSTKLNFKKIINISFIGILVPFIFGCSKPLSREEAAKAIKQQENLPSNETRDFDFTQTVKINYDIPYKKVLTDFSSESYNLNYSESIKAAIPPTPQRIPLFETLQREGLINYSTEVRDIDYGSPQGLGGSDYYWSIPAYATVYHIATPSEKCNQYVIGSQVKVATLEFGEVTGIVERKEFKMAEVSYNVKQTNITPFGSIVFKMNEEIFNRSTTFTKYDDGWRIGN